MELFAEQGNRATFFVLGWVTERDPSLVRVIAESGHELACHSYAHKSVDRLTPDQFRDDLRRARNAIEDAAGVKVVGYRAPTFSIRKRSLWALEILAEEGFLYDSSIFPIYHNHYGYPEAPRFSFHAELPSGRRLFEIPMSQYANAVLTYRLAAEAICASCPWFIHVGLFIISKGTFGSL